MQKQVTLSLVVLCGLLLLGLYFLSSYARASNPSPLIYATFLGGNSDDYGYDGVTDTAGNIYISGITKSIDFPVTSHLCSTTLYNSSDGNLFVTKINQSKGLVFSTILGTCNDNHIPLGIDMYGNVYVAGVTNYSNYPTTPGAMYPSFTNSDDESFITKISSDGSSLVYSTFWGPGGNWTEIHGAATDSAGNVYITGYTNSTAIPITPGAYDTTISNAFISKINPDGSSVVYSTYIKGRYGCDIALDSTGCAYVVGDIFVQDSVSHRKVFVYKLNPTGTGLVYSYLLGGSGDNGG